MRYALLYFAFITQGFCEELTLPDPLDMPKKDIKVQQRDENTGLMKKPWDTSDDKHILSFYGGGNANIKKVANIVQLEGDYSFQMESFWPSIIISHTMGEFSSLTTPNPAITPNYNDDLLEANESVTSIGAGFGYRTRIFANALGERSFEKISFYLNYNIFSETFNSETYTGFGIKTNYGIFWRTSRDFHFGFKFSYNLMSLRKAAEFENQRGSDRSLTLSWPSIGLELGMYL